MSEVYTIQLGWVSIAKLRFANYLANMRDRQILHLVEQAPLKRSAGLPSLLSSQKYKCGICEIGFFLMDSIVYHVDYIKRRADRRDDESLNL